MSVSFSPRSLDQVEDIARRFAKENPAAAHKFVERVYTIAKFLSEYPRSGRPTEIDDVRVYLAYPYPYLIAFRTVAGTDEIRVLRVQFAQRLPFGINDPGRDTLGEIPLD
jgi:toxin ParE1/3/4